MMPSGNSAEQHSGQVSDSRSAVGNPSVGSAGGNVNGVSAIYVTDRSRRAQVLRSYMSSGSFPDGYCYLRIVKRVARVLVGSEMGEYPTVESLLLRSANEFDPDMVATVVSGEDNGIRHVEYGLYGLDILSFLRAVATERVWPEGSFGEQIVCETPMYFAMRTVSGLDCKLGGKGLPNSHFFKPTGFESAFEVEKFDTQPLLVASHKRTLEEAVAHIGERQGEDQAVSVSLEPGSGKTTVLPFRFSNTPVCVILPTGFDALAAYRLASDVANIDTGMVKENNRSNVTYLDSYTAGFYLYKYRRDFPFKIVIIDESDSNAGITKTLTEVKFPGCFVIHLSGTPEGREVLSSSAFDVESFDSLPELSDVYFEAVDFIKSRCKRGRGLVMVPSAAVAKQIHSMIKNSRKIDCDMSVEELDSLIQDQSRNEVLIADDSCVRGINLNLDMLFDFQLVGCGPDTRTITRHEQEQRKKRVGRTKPGTYYYTPREFSGSSFSKWDVFRNNVARAVFGLPLHPCDLQVDLARLRDLMVSRIEPYELQVSLPSLVAKSPPSSSSGRRRRSSTALEKGVPMWMVWASGYMGTHKRGGSDGGESVAVTSASSSSSSSLRPSNSVSAVGSPTGQSMATTIPSSVFGAADVSRKPLPVVGEQNPVIDLSSGSMADWPDALRAAYNKGHKLCFVKPGQWTYTQAGSGVDCMQRLLAVIREGPTFTPAEMEVVCRSWNVLVSRMNFSFASGKDAWGDRERVLFILDYFSSYNTMLLS